MTIRKTLLIALLCFGCTQKPAPYFLRGEEFHGKKELDDTNEYQFIKYDAKKGENIESHPIQDAYKVNQEMKAIDKSCNFTMPIEGIITSKFSINNQDKNCQEGINIKSNGDQQVKASSAGKILYVGKGPKWYGNMIIIEHNKNTTTTYSYLDSIDVKIGDKVTQGQIIGHIKSTNPQKNKSYLCFAMRKRGKAVNPLLYINCK
ncbi:murein hydrolase activator EnvC family protein [Ehrlichia japonica]|uniref:murein hydrolase activator EnvC family protein n=1 Tax=Ehrlichia japonica TaxID=391036 RepID=UPI0005C4D337|nr:M23 family metallopeptidase [Ehrlichia japonica]